MKISTFNIQNNYKSYDNCKTRDIYNYLKDNYNPYLHTCLIFQVLHLNQSYITILNNCYLILLRSKSSSHLDSLLVTSFTVPLMKGFFRLAISTSSKNDLVPPALHIFK